CSRVSDALGKARVFLGAHGNRGLRAAADLHATGGSSPARHRACATLPVSVTGTSSALFSELHFCQCLAARRATGPPHACVASHGRGTASTARGRCSTGV